MLMKRESFAWPDLEVTKPYEVNIAVGFYRPDGARTSTLITQHMEIMS